MTLLKKVGVLSIVFLFLFSFVSFAFAADNGITKFGSDINIEENTSVTKAVAIGGSIVVAGNVQEDVVAIGGTVVLKSSAVVLGDVVAVGGRVEKAPEALIKGEIVEIGIPGSNAFAKNSCLPFLGIGYIAIKIISFLGLLILALITVAFFTKQIGNTSLACEKQSRHCFWVGLLSLMAVAPIALLLIISIVGIVFLPLWLMLVVAVLFFAKIAISQLIGKKLLKLFRVIKKPMLLEVTFGLIVFNLIALIPLLGSILQWILTIIAVGAATLTRLGTRKA